MWTIVDETDTAATHTYTCARATLCADDIKDTGGSADRCLKHAVIAGNQDNTMDTNK